MEGGRKSERRALTEVRGGREGEEGREGGEEGKKRNRSHR